MNAPDHLLDADVRAVTESLLADPVAPAEVINGFTDLHDYCDANMLLDVCPRSDAMWAGGTEKYLDWANRVILAVDAWIREGGLLGSR